MKCINEKGFTLIELIIVMIIIGILTAVVVPRFLDLSSAAEAAACQQNQASIESAANIGYAKYALGGDAKYPATIQAMVDSGWLPEMPTCPAQGGGYTYLATGNQAGTVSCALNAHNQ